MTKLLIVESPAKAKTINKYLGKDYKVVASIGHIRDLPKSNKNAIDIKAGFVPTYVISPGKEKVVREITAAAAKAQEVILATDPDREGEAIAWHIKEACHLKKPRRIVFHEITKEAVSAALMQGRGIDENLFRAQEARRVLDRLFGYDLSGLIWKKLRYGLSAGRVQSPALRILAEREREIKAFVPEKFWVIEALFGQGKYEIPFNCSEEPKTAETAERIVNLAKQSQFTVEEIEQTRGRRFPRPPFTTSTLQQAASSRLGYSPSLTMRLAQKLYEAGAITYMRTDSTNLGGRALAEIGALVKNKFGESYYTGPRTYKTKSKNAQEAHEAVRPTSLGALIAGKTSPENRLYQLIWARTISSQMAEAEVLKTKVILRSDKEIPPFITTGQQVTFDGWLAADPHARGEDIDLPKLTKGEKLKLLKIESVGKETEPPRRFSEAGLVKELEKRGIGRPSTYAPTIKNIQDRGYVEKEGRSLKPTELGLVVSDFVENNFSSYISDTFTAGLEDKLDEIARGEKKYVAVLSEFYQPFHQAIKDKADIEKISNLGPVAEKFKCPVCGGGMVWKLGRSGKFMSCERFPDCAGARQASGVELAPPKELAETCPDCGGQLVEREGRFGRFVACGNYPKCKYVKKDENGGAGGPNDTGVKCPVCNQGTMVEKRGRFGPFFGCSNYPKCKNIIKSRPTGRNCPQCGSLMMEGTKTIPERCSNKACPNHNPHKIEKKELD